MSQSRRIVETPRDHDEAPVRADTSLRLAVLVLCAAALVALLPFWVPLVVAAWTAIVARPLHHALTKRIHRRKSAAALVTVLLVVAFVTPLLIVTLSLSAAAVELGHRLQAMGSVPAALRSLADSAGQTPIDFQHLDWHKLLDLLGKHAQSAMGLAQSLFGAAAVIAIGLVVFVSAFYTFLFEGLQLHEWLLVHSPLTRGQFHRLSRAFGEVGRGLLIGVGLTALLQGAVATLGYLICGVPQPLVLGLVTVFASLIPSVGSGLVWAPVTVGLALSGRPDAAVAMLVIGCIVSVVDNLVRPLLAKYGQLQMNGLLLFVAMLGGIAMFGAGGLLLGPLLVRLAVEGLTMLRERSPELFPGD